MESDKLVFAVRVSKQRERFLLEIPKALRHEVERRFGLHEEIRVTLEKEEGVKEDGG